MGTGVSHLALHEPPVVEATELIAAFPWHASTGDWARQCIAAQRLDDRLRRSERLNVGLLLVIALAGLLCV